MARKPGDPGLPGAGRPKGSKNKRTVEMQERLDAMGCDPVEFQAKVMMSDLECLYCKENEPNEQGKTIISLSQAYVAFGLTLPKEIDAKMASEMMIPCPNCGGSGTEVTSTGLRSKAASDLLQYTVPKLKSVEHNAGERSEPLVFKLMGTDAALVGHVERRDPNERIEAGPTVVEGECSEVKDAEDDR